MSLPAGSILGKYRIVTSLGQGGMGEVYLAEHTTLGGRAAVKVLSPELSSQPEMVKRFLREASAAYQLRHPGIIRIHDLGSEGDLTYFSMDYIEGRPLSRVIGLKGALGQDEVVAISRQVLAALVQAHQAGVVHRDLKPDNIMVGQGSEVVVTDFGIAKVAQATKLTRTGVFLGTLHYTSPEQIQGQGVDARSDLYSWGVVMYEMATGATPFAAEDTAALLYKQVYEAPAPPTDLVPGLSPGLSQVILKAMAKDPGERYQSAAEMLAALDELKQKRKRHRRRRGEEADPAEEITVARAPREGKPRRRGRLWAVAALVAVGAVGLGAWLAHLADAPPPPAPAPTPAVVAPAPGRDQARDEAERKAKLEAERKAEEAARLKAKAEAERKAKEQARRLAAAEAERKVKLEAARKAKAEAERKAEEEAERKAKLEAERKIKEEARRKAQAEAERLAREEARRRAQAEAKEKARREARMRAAKSHPGYLGIKLQDFTPEIARAMGQEPGPGALVAEVTPDSPAQRAGLQRGDVVTIYEGGTVTDPQALAKAVAGYPAGSRVSLVVARGGRLVNLEAVLGDLGSARAQALRESAQRDAMRDRLDPVITSEESVDRPGSDMSNFPMNEPEPLLCASACMQEPRCRAYTYVRPGVQGKLARCWLKARVPPVHQSDCCTSGVKTAQGLALARMKMHFYFLGRREAVAKDEPVAVIYLKRDDFLVRDEALRRMFRLVGQKGAQARLVNLEEAIKAVRGGEMQGVICTSGDLKAARVSFPKLAVIRIR